MKKIIFISVLTVFATLNAQAQSFDDILARIVASNPEIEALNAENNAALEAVAAENNLSDPEISVKNMWGQEDNKFGIGISQSFDWPGLYKARSRKTTSVKAALSELYASTYLDKVMEIRIYMIDYIAAKCNYSYFASVKNNMDKLLEKYNEAYSQGEVSILELNKVKIERLRVNRKLADCELKCESALLSLQSLTTDKEAISLLKNVTEYPQDYVLSEAEYESLIDCDPGVKYYSAMADVAQSNIQAAKMQGLPSFSIGYEYEREEGQNFHGLSLSMSLPFFSKKHVKAAAISEKAAYEAKGVSAKIAALSQMREQRRSVLSLAEQIDDYSDIISGTAQLELLRKALDGGEINLFTYIQEINYFIDAQCEYQDLRYNYYTALTKLNRLKPVLK